MKMSMKQWLWTLSIAAILPKTVRNSPMISTGHIDDSCPFAVCYRKLQSGKKMLETHVRRTVRCDDIEDCRRACNNERTFSCEGFNYRRTSNRGRIARKCELTATPYRGMDLRKDFVVDSECDFYERRPSCPPSGNPREGTGDTWNYERAGVGKHSHDTTDEYLRFDNRRPIFPVRTNYQTGAGIRDPPTIHYDPDRTYHSTDRPPHEQSYLFHTYAPRVNGRTYSPRFFERRTDLEEHHIAGPSRSRDDERGPNDTDYNRFNERREDRVRFFYDMPDAHSTYDRSRPRETQHFYGKFYNYGGTFGYGQNYVPASKVPLYGDEEMTPKSCSIRVTAGSKIVRNLLRRSYPAKDLNHCEILCITEQSFQCASFTYRYNILATDPTDNCLLSDIPYQDLNFYTDLEPERNYDVYSIVDDSRACNAKKTFDRNPSDECFWRVKSGFSLPQAITRMSIFVSDLGECQLACTTSREFTCRTLAMRYGDRHRERQGSKPNCLLSDWPSKEIDPAIMPDKDGTELYERGSFARGCEPYPFVVPSLTSPRAKEHTGIDVDEQSDKVCYSGYHRPCGLTPYAVISSIRADSESECRRECSRIREAESVPCMSFSYKIINHGTKDNCLLSDISIRDLRPGHDYTYEDGNALYAWKEHEPSCTIFRQSFPTPSGITDEVYRPMNYNYKTAGPFYSTITDTWREAQNQPSGLSHVASPPGVIDEANFVPTRSKVEPSYGNVKPESEISTYTPDNFAHGGLGFFYPREISLLRRYTVSGYPCRNGTSCQQNEIAQFWSCEIEHGESGSWDYCCEPTHRCGYSEGYSYPWCYVGPVEDQWRPCSEVYYPYSSNSDVSTRQPYLGTDDVTEDHFESPRYKQTARHWPVIYLHKDPPPNCTKSLSFLSNNGRFRKIR